MAKFSVTAQRTASTTLAVGVITAVTATLRRIKLYDVMLGSEATPADNAFLWQIPRVSTAGTSTAVTPSPLDTADSASATVAGQNATIDPTPGVILLTVPLNQRATFRWVAAPGSELVGPATNANGMSVRTPTASTVSVSCTLLFEEQ